MIRGDNLTIRGCEFLSVLIKQSTKGDVSFSLPPVPLLWKASYIIQFSLDHLGPTLVIHPCLYLSARLISHSFYRSVTCDDPGCQLWVFNVEVTAYLGIAPPLYSYGCLITLVLSLGMLQETTLGGMPLSLSVISVYREQNCLQQRLLAVWTFFVHSRTFLPPRCGPQT